LPEIVGHIDAEEADTMISDDLAMQHTRHEEGAGQGKQDIINIGVIDRHFEAGETVTLQALKDKGLMPKKVGRMKVLADGELNKPLIVKAEDYSVQAIKMIELTGGTVIILKD
jgi:large subunit ribosomal protein L15